MRVVLPVIHRRGVDSIEEIPIRGIELHGKFDRKLNRFAVHGEEIAEETGISPSVFEVHPSFAVREYVTGDDEGAENGRPGLHDFVEN